MNGTLMCNSFILVICWEFKHSCFKFVFVGKSCILVIDRDALTAAESLKSCVVFANFSDGDCECDCAAWLFYLGEVPW